MPQIYTDIGCEGVLPQIARMSTDIGIYKICENPWNPWENKSQAANDVLPQIAQINTDIGCEGVSHKSHNQDVLCVKIRKETWWCEGKNVFLRLNSL